MTAACILVFNVLTPAAWLHKALSNPQPHWMRKRPGPILRPHLQCSTANGLQVQSQMLLVLAFDQSATSSTDIAELQMFVFHLQPLGFLHDSSPLCACPVMPAFGACYSIMPLLSLPSDLGHSNRIYVFFAPQTSLFMISSWQQSDKPREQQSKL